MIRVGFVLIGSNSWIAGLNYRRNLLYALSVLDDRKIEPYLFIGNKTDEQTVKMFSPFAKIVRSSLFDRKSPLWTIHAILRKYFGVYHIFNSLMRKHGISVVSHSEIIGDKLPYKTINWIPDFQPLRLPEMFSNDELEWKKTYFKNIIRRSDLIILSSHDALNDFIRFVPCYSTKARVLHFVSQPDQKIYDIQRYRYIEEKYGFRGKFFYLPNQLWKHKNHNVVFEAIKILKERGLNVLVLCSGHMDDYRNKDHVAHLQAFIKDHNLGERIKLLGLIDYIDVLFMMRNCISIINPSLFEGWSTTVEEAKSIGKNMILSDILVHREQNPPQSVYFPPHDPDILADTLARIWAENEGGPDAVLEASARRSLHERTRQFALQYQDIVLETMNNTPLK